MAPLERCETCGRHLFAGTSACPFCAAGRARARAAKKVALAVTAASAVVLGSFGCAYGMPDGPYDDATVDGESDATDATDSADATDASDSATPPDTK